VSSRANLRSSEPPSRTLIGMRVRWRPARRQTEVRQSAALDRPGGVEAPDLGPEDGVLPKEQSRGKPTTRRYGAQKG